MDGVQGAPQVPSLLLSTSMASCYHIPPPPIWTHTPSPPLLPSRLLLSLWLEAFGRVLACATCIQHYLTLHGAYLGWDVRQARNALNRRKDKELLQFFQLRQAHWEGHSGTAGCGVSARGTLYCNAMVGHQSRLPIRECHGHFSTLAAVNVRRSALAMASANTFLRGHLDFLAKGLARLF